MRHGDEKLGSGTKATSSRSSAKNRPEKRNPKLPLAPEKSQLLPRHHQSIRLQPTPTRQTRRGPIQPRNLHRNHGQSSELDTNPKIQPPQSLHQLPQRKQN